LVDPLAEFDWPEGAEPADTAPIPAASGVAAAKRVGRGLWNAADHAAVLDGAVASGAAAGGRARRRAPSAAPDDETADAIVAASWGLPDEDEPVGRGATATTGGAPSDRGRGRGVGVGGAGAAAGSQGRSSGGGGGRRAGAGRGARPDAAGSTGERSDAADDGAPVGRGRPARLGVDGADDEPLGAPVRRRRGAWSDDPEPAGRRARSGAAGDERAVSGRGGWRGRRGAAAGVPEGPRTPQEEAELAREICLRQLAVRPRTRAELATALTSRGISAETTADVLDRYDEVGIIDDAAFARAWVTSRHHGRGLARRALADELRHKGVDAATVGEALDDLDESTEAETARRLADRKLRSTRGTPEQVFRRLVGMLARKGYPPRVAIRVVKDALAARSDEAAEFAEQIDTDALAEAQAGLEDEERARADD
jgi:regulatory protein